MAKPFRFPSSPKSQVLIQCGDVSENWAGASQMQLSESQIQKPRRLGRWYLMILTCSTGGLQVVWTLIMSNGTPFLITLGLHESLTALVWVVAPLCGVIVQPYVGILSDRCQNPWGRRRPFIVVGATGSIICMLGLASNKSIWHFVAALVHADAHGAVTRSLILMSAVLWLFGLNICIQPLQSGIRALIVDSCGVDEQVRASAWASRMTGVGNIVGYFFGFFPLHSILPFLHVTQFSWLCLVASAALAVTVAITSLVVKEQDPRSLPAPVSPETSFWATVKHVIWGVTTMPKAVRQVCQVQFFAWLGWFPYLFYISSYVGDLYAAPILSGDVHMAASMKAIVIEDAVRLGSLASLVSAVFALLTNIMIPNFIDGGQQTDGDVKKESGVRLQISIIRAWSFSHLLFAFCMFSTFFVRSQTSATVLAALVGIPWALTLWVPFAIIGREIAARQERNAKILEGELEPAQQDQAGAIVGLHNCAISAPQILAALACGCIFSIASSLGSQDGIGWVLRFGGLGPLIAAFLAAKIGT